MNGRAELVFIGLSLSSSWGNGHATTYRALLRGLAAIGQKVLFLERDVPWYAENRDLPDPDFCELGLYASVEELARKFGSRIAGARAVIVGSYVPDGIAVLDFVLEQASGCDGVLRYRYAHHPGGPRQGRRGLYRDPANPPP